MGLTDNAVAFYDLDADVLDDSGNGENGTNNGVTFSGGVGVFDGFSDFTIPASLLSANTYTLSLWFNATSVATVYQAMFALFTGNGDAIEVFLTADSGSGGAFLPNFNSTRVVAGTFSAGALTHLAGLMSAGTMDIYVNGAFNRSVSGGLTTFTPVPHVGSRGGLFFFAGTMQSLGLFSDTKDATWVTSVYNSGVPLTWSGMAGGGGGSAIGADALHHYGEHVMRGAG